MRQAIRWRLLHQDPTDGAQLPRLGRREMRVLTPEQSRVFLSGAQETHYGPVLAVALTTGIRPSEYLALESARDRRTRSCHAAIDQWRCLKVVFVAEIASIVVRLLRPISRLPSQPRIESIYS